jgi:hypothetical protein
MFAFCLRALEIELGNPNSVKCASSLKKMSRAPRNLERWIRVASAIARCGAQAHASHSTARGLHANMAAIGAFAGLGATAVRLGAGKTTTRCTAARARSSLHYTARRGATGTSVRVGAAARPAPARARGLTVVARVASTTPPGGGNDGDTRVATSVGGVIDTVRDRIKRNFRMLPVALICILVGFSMCAFFPHPESPGDATICFTIIFLAEFLSSVLYAAKRPRGLLKWLRRGKVVPLMLNCFKIGVLYGLFCDAFKVGS